MPRRRSRRGGGNEGEERGRGGGRRRGLQRAFGLFHCKNCDVVWASAHVYRVVGTLIVPYRQACRGCEEFTGPFKTNCIRCGRKICHNECYDEESDNDDDEEEEDDDEDEQVDRPHEKSLCEKCMAGNLCGGGRRRRRRRRRQRRQ